MSNLIEVTLIPATDNRSASIVIDGNHLEPDEAWALADSIRNAVIRTHIPNGESA